MRAEYERYLFLVVYTFWLELYPLVSIVGQIFQQVSFWSLLAFNDIALKLTSKWVRSESILNLRGKKFELRYDLPNSR